MNFDYDEVTVDLLVRLKRFMATEIYPREKAFDDWYANEGHDWSVWPEYEPLKAKARDQGLWNLFLPLDYGDISPGLSTLQYAPLAEEMGRVTWASEIFNCLAPDTGNMEVLARYGTPEQQERWLKPLLAGKIRSAFLMTEPQVASSDATNIETSIVADGDDYLINGRKWWTSGFMDPRCELLICMGKTDPSAPTHSQQSMVLIAKATPGVRLVRAVPAFGRHNPPGGDVELALENVRVPKTNLLVGEGRGFEIAQGRLGPGRIHHAMRSIGQAQRALELMAARVEDRVAFGKKLSAQGSIQQDVARCFCEIEQARLLTLKAADAIDRHGAKGAMDLIAAIKIVAPSMAQSVADRALQVFGGMGVSDDTPIAKFFTWNRFLRIADGPDEVHLSQLGRMKIRQLNSPADPG
ncbi:acyl-CoA dehydrogenase family protein [soil metagenome]